MALAVEEEETVPLPVTCARRQVVQMQSKGAVASKVRLSSSVRLEMFNCDLLFLTLFRGSNRG